MNVFAKPTGCVLSVLLWAMLGACAQRFEPRSLYLPPVSESVVKTSQEVPVQAITTYHGGQLRIFVGSSASTQILYLSSADAALWQIYLFPGAKVQTVYLSGELQKAIIYRSRKARHEPLPKVVNLGFNPSGDRDLSFGPPMNMGSEKGSKFQAEVKSATGLFVTKFQARDFVWGDQAFAVSDAKVDDVSLQSHFPETLKRDLRTPLAEWHAVRRDIAALVLEKRLPERLLGLNAEPQEINDPKSYLPLLPDDDVTTTQPLNKLCGRFQLGTRGDDRLWCDEGLEPVGGKVITKWVLAGAGNDVLTDTRVVSQLMAGGTGDDVIAADGWNDVLYFERRWGNDVVSARCYGEKAGYVVFGRGVDPRDLRWVSANEIEDRTSGSRILFVDEPCFHFLAIESGAIPSAPDAAD